jgi:YidC/Oxa1 family membrane protein insertase
MQEQRSSSSGNFALFILCSCGVFLLWSMIVKPPVNEEKQPEKAAAQTDAEPGKKGEKEEEQEGGKGKSDKSDDDAKDKGAADKDKKVKDAEKDKKEADVAAPPPADLGPMPKYAGKEQWFTLGSADKDDPYRMLVTLTDRGAAVARIELNSPRYRALMDDDGLLADTGGYLGRVVMDTDRQGNGCLVQVVGRGTPAEKAGLKPGDIIKAVGSHEITGAEDLREILQTKTRPGRDIKLLVSRGGKEIEIPVTLGIPPMEVVRPEGEDPLSFLMTLSQIDGEKLPKMEADKEQPKEEIPAYVSKELKGLNMRRGTWEVAGKPTRDKIEFFCTLPRWGLRVVKTYRLVPIPTEEQDNPDYGAYNLAMEVKIENVGKKSHRVAYQLDGPTGLPIEGWWYANKVGYCWGAGLRDVIVRRNGQTPVMVSCSNIGKDDLEAAWDEESISYIGVDAQYFSAVLLPLKENPEDIWFSKSMPLRVGPTRKKLERLTNVTCRLRSVAMKLEPGEEGRSHGFNVFAGPKREAILANYELTDLIYYGWFDVVARPLVWILHAFYKIVCNYGLAILLLTVLVRGLMHPMSRKQALGAQKMAELQPEIKRIQEKYKKDMEARTKAQQELFKKHNYNPLSGCLVMFVQLPIFIGLYRGLMVDVELRGSPLLSSGIRWCSNLAAPDMLYNWYGWMPDWITYGLGAFKLGPYFNLLPIATVILFLLQQKMFMPPPADEQQAMQQNIMKYMMLFMGVLFFKVASGLCIYFIASSLWGLAEKQFLPKSPKKEGGPPPAEKKPERPKKPDGGGNGSAKRSKGKKSGRRK